MRNLIIGITGASGTVYPLALLKALDALRTRYDKVIVIYTPSAELVAREEMGVDLAAELSGYRQMGVEVYRSDDPRAPSLSSSALVNTDMVIAPASVNTIAKLASGIQDNALTRGAIGVLRMGGKLVLVVRETPLSTIDLRNLYVLSSIGAVVLPASPGFYHNPRTVEDLVMFVVGKVLDVLGVEHSLYRRWAQPR